ncbi:MAG: hypothetical protein M4579_007022 [Chaenotheca gracillima]|nr:MAG: hypothetical protein M4579_007022 [Chaenotheca gracillima]
MPLNARAIFPASDPEFVSFGSRRSVTHGTHGMVACTQPLAAQAGLRILREGGNAADASVAVAAALNISEPSSTGIGGDMFALFYDADTKKVRSLNGSGRASHNISLDGVRKDLGIKDGASGSIPMSSVHAVSTPGAAAGWVDTLELLGNKKLSMEQILMPAIEMGEEGFPVSELSSFFWRSGEQSIRNASPNFGEMLRNDPKAKDGKRAPGPGEIMVNKTLANTFRLLAKHGKKGFYEGSVADALVKVVQDLGGHLDHEDLKKHAATGTEEVEPISVKFNGQNISKVHDPPHGTQEAKGTDEDGVEVWECPPNGQGIVALMALGILEQLEKSGKIRQFKESEHNSPDYIHAVVEALRIAFADASWFVTDPNVVKVPVKEMLSPEYLASRAKLFDPKKASDVLDHGSPAHNHSDTVYFAVTDKWGNGCSFINSNYGGFGTAIIPKGCGFTLQNRAANFTLEKNHPNVIAPGKRPYHTIIPAMITNPRDGSLHSVYGVMGGFMQPQGHVQVLLNMLAFKYNPQAALDAPRFCIGAGMPEQGKVLDRSVYLEDGISEEIADTLRKMGHNIEIVKGHKRGLFGRGQVIRVHTDESGQKVFSGGSDPRGDGIAIPY